VERHRIDCAWTHTFVPARELTVQHAYDSAFMHYADASARHAALTVSRILRVPLAVDSVLDIGCAKGTWLAAWKETGVTTIHGADGAYVDQDRLIIPRNAFTPANLAAPLALGRRFDLVQSLEVAEHIVEASAGQFIVNLVNHSNGLVLFSAAPPGQGGEFHVNEQGYDYWRQKFAGHDYEAFDYLRPRIASDMSISFWYRYNTILYVHRDRAGALPPEVIATRVDSTLAIPDIAPVSFRLRKAVVRSLPVSLRYTLARFKARFLPTGRF
jgi:SAM-dependent methyltransferase